LTSLTFVLFAHLHTSICDRTTRCLYTHIPLPT
jgi:hypothetical protein